LARKQILAQFLKKRYVATDLNLTRIAQELAGYSAADLQLLVDESAKLAMRADKPIGEEHFEVGRTAVSPSISCHVEAEYERFGAGSAAATSRSKISFRN